MTKEELDTVLRSRLGKMDHDLRDYIDRRLTELKGDLISLLRKGDAKAIELIKTLQRKKIISTREADRLLLLDSVG